MSQLRLPGTSTFGVWQDWADQVASLVNRYFAEDIRVAPTQIPNFSKAKLPPASRAKFCLIIVIDEVGGVVPAFSDGTNWRRVTDRAVVS